MTTFSFRPPPLLSSSPFWPLLKPSVFEAFVVVRGACALLVPVALESIRHLSRLNLASSSTAADAALSFAAALQE